MEEIRTKDVIAAEKAAAAAEAARKAAMDELEKGDQPNEEEGDKEDRDDESQADDGDGEEGDEVEESSVGEFQELPPKPKIRRKYKHLAFTERDYKMRDPVEEYRIIKEIEDEVLSFQKENVKTYVISAGVLYGKGEAVFNSHIQKAWLQDPVRLPYVGDGNNLVPTIHVTDLARMVLKVFEKKPDRQYIFAVDNN